MLYLTCISNVQLGSMKPFSSHDLRTVTNDVDSAGNRTIMFTVVSSLRVGRLVRVNVDTDLSPQLSGANLRP